MRTTLIIAGYFFARIRSIKEDKDIGILDRPASVFVFALRAGPKPIGMISFSFGNALGEGFRWLFHCFPLKNLPFGRLLISKFYFLT
jgi:hypothetical protein